MTAFPSSLWADTLAGGDQADRSSLPGDLDVDVAIVGAGYTGLWTAYYLRCRDPNLRIAVLEAERVGFGASGRNGGWCSALLPMSLDSIAEGHGRAEAVSLQRAMHATVDEVGAVAAAEGIDCHFVKGGTMVFARNRVQAARLHADIEQLRTYGFDEDDVVWLGAAEARARLAAHNVEGAQYTPHCATIHPARLAHGLAAAVERRGVPIFERTRAASIGPGIVRTEHGTVRADIVVRATEAYTASLAGHRRDLVPVYSLMIATEPLAPSFFDAVGWAERSTFSDGRRMVIYGQRTADDRIAFGGRGAPYHLGSQTRPEFDVDARIHGLLDRTLRDLFPGLDGVSITHRWGGPVGVPRDWTCSVGFDRTSGLAWAGGYVGDGVATTNLAGRTLADLITGTESELTTLSWVDHRSRRWEPEPLRWIGVNTMVRLTSSIDAYEDRHGRPERWRSRLLDRVTGH